MLAIVSAALLSIGTPTPAAAGISSQQALLAPQLHRGETLTWFGTITDDLNSSNEHCRNCGPNSWSDVLACSVTDQNRDGFVVSRRVRSFLKDQPHNRVFEHPAIIVGGAQEYAIDGSPLNDDPICLLYSPSMYGSPPKTLAVGTTWRFSRPPNFRYLAGLHGTATVTKIDLTSNTVSLRIVETGAGSALVDMTVSDGGVIETESDRWDTHPTSSAVPKTIADPSDKASWTRQHQSLAGLWNYPADPIPDVLDPDGHFIAVERLSIGGTIITFVRIWHFGPFIVQDIVPTLPRIRDVLLVLGTIVQVLLIGKLIVFSFDARTTGVSPIARKRTLQLTGALAIIAAAGSMWWVYH